MKPAEFLGPHLDAVMTRPSIVLLGLVLDPKSVQYTVVPSTAICCGTLTKPATGVGFPVQPARGHFATRPWPASSAAGRGGMPAYTRVLR